MFFVGFSFSKLVLNYLVIHCVFIGLS